MTGKAVNTIKVDDVFNGTGIATYVSQLKNPIAPDKQYGVTMGGKFAGGDRDGAVTLPRIGPALQEKPTSPAR